MSLLKDMRKEFMVLSNLQTLIDSGWENFCIGLDDKVPYGEKIEVDGYAKSFIDGSFHTVCIEKVEYIPEEDNSSLPHLKDESHFEMGWLVSYSKETPGKRLDETNVKMGSYDKRFSDYPKALSLAVEHMKSIERKYNSSEKGLIISDLVNLFEKLKQKRDIKNVF